MSSYSFAGTTSSYISIASSADTRMGTGDFTIEWYQYQTENNPYPRIFQIGSYQSTPAINMGVSIEDPSFYYWYDDNNTESNSVGTIFDTWVHFAIVRSSGQTTIYKNGDVLISAFSDTTDYNSTYNLIIGNETDRSSDAAFTGYLAYFHIIKGVAKYTSTFTVPTDYPAVTANTVYLLKPSDSTGSNITVVGVSTVDELPPGFPRTTTPTITRPTKPAYGNNSLVFYEPNTLSSSTTFGVRNSRAVSRRT
jgi:hypothetical protein